MGYKIVSNSCDLCGDRVLKYTPARIGCKLIAICSNCADTRLTNLKYIHTLSVEERTRLRKKSKELLDKARRQGNDESRKEPKAMTALLQAGVRHYTYQDVYDIAHNQAFNLLSPFPPVEWSRCQPSMSFNDCYWRGYAAGLRKRWSAVYLVHCVTHCLAKSGGYYRPGRNESEKRKQLAAEIRERRANGMHTPEDNRDSFRRIHSKEYLAIVQYR